MFYQLSFSRLRLKKKQHLGLKFEINSKIINDRPMFYRIKLIVFKSLLLNESIFLKTTIIQQLNQL